VKNRHVETSMRGCVCGLGFGPTMCVRCAMHGLPAGPASHAWGRQRGRELEQRNYCGAC
jgi:hypothetical protein